MIDAIAVTRRIKKIKKMIAFLTIYLISTVGVWINIRIVYSKGGAWSCINPTIVDLAWTILPLFNSIACIGLTLENIRHCIEKQDFNNSSKILNKFFNIKK